MLNSFSTAVLAGAFLATGTNAINLMTQSAAEATFMVAGNAASECYGMMHQLYKPLPDYWAISNKGLAYKDDSFGESPTSLFWNGETSDLNTNVSWVRATEKFPGITLWGKSGHVNAMDVNQGEVGDCWFLAAGAALAEQPTRIRKVFLENDNTPNSSHIYAVQLYTLGVPHTVIVDDFIPVKSNGGLLMTNPGKDNAMWMLILERAFAKYHGNYEHIQGGQTYYAVRTLTGAPWAQLRHSGSAAPSEDEVWAQLVKKDAEGAIMTAGTQAGSDKHTGGLGLVLGHAYTVVGAHETSNGDKIVKVRNPWGSDSQVPMFNAYANGPNAAWTAADKAAMGFSTSTEDGLSFLTLDEYYVNFSSTVISENNDHMHSDHYLKKADLTTGKQVPGKLGKASNSRHVMTVKSDVAQSVWISANTYDDREYKSSADCKNNIVSYNLAYADIQKMQTPQPKYHYTAFRMGTHQLPLLTFAAGETLEIELEFDFSQGVVPDWSLVAWGDKGAVTITDEDGNGSTDTWTDIPYNEKEQAFISGLQSYAPTSVHDGCTYGLNKASGNADMTPATNEAQWWNNLEYLQYKATGDRCKYYVPWFQFKMSTEYYTRAQFTFGGYGECDKYDDASGTSMTSCKWTCDDAAAGCGIITQVGDYFSSWSSGLAVAGQ